MAAGDVSYEVMQVKLIVQDKNMACWYASAMMVINWYEERTCTQVCRTVDDQTLKIYKANNGLNNDQIIPMAKRLGLVPVPPLSPTIAGLTDWLQTYGPLWTNGKRHIVVIAGIRGSDAAGYEVKVYDPWPGKGVSWRTLAGWYTGFDAAQANNSSRDTGSDVEAVFLHAP